ncbi:MAG: division plane positioning ATPase MipZ [Pseudolabrys sp.]
MIHEQSTRGRVIVVGNEKGGSGKSTIAIHVAVALMKSGQRVATIDLDSRQRSFSRYIENRRAWAQHVARDLEIPDHFLFEERVDYPTADDHAAEREALTETVEAAAKIHDFVVIDTPGHNRYLMRLAHTVADTLVTPLNDSFVDFDVLGSVHPETFGVTGVSHYARVVEEARHQRQTDGHPDTDWIVLRNRLSSLGSRNKRFVGQALQELSERLDFRYVDGLTERVIFREFYPRGLTAVDDLDEATLGTRPTMSHVTARLEMENLLGAMRLGQSSAGIETFSHDRDAA